MDFLTNKAYLEAFLESSDLSVIRFNDDLIIHDNNYSSNIQSLLFQQLNGQNIVDVIFKYNRDIENIKEIFSNIIELKSIDAANLYFSLLPKKVTINEKTIKIEFKVIEVDSFMLILKDVTQEELSTNKLKLEQSLYKMVISLITNKEDFISLKKEFEFFTKNYKTIYKQTNLKHIILMIDSFRGLFLEFGFQSTYDALVKLEFQLKKPLSNISSVLDEIYEKIDLNKVFKDEMNFVIDTLGYDIFDYTKDAFKKRKLSQIEVKLKELQSHEQISKDDIEFLLNEVSVLNGINLYDKLKVYSNQVIKNIDSKDKKINPPIITGDKNIFLPKEFESFIKDLTHLYRNIVMHGLETFIERFEKNKQQNGQITTLFSKDENILTIEILDDGRGIELDFIKHRVLEKGIVSDSDIDKFTDDELLLLLFDKRFYIKNQLDFINGKGFGLSSIKDELEKLGGELFVETTMDVGSRFVFKIPLKTIALDTLKAKELFYDVLETNLMSYIDLNSNINVKDKLAIDEINFYDYYTCIELKNENTTIMVVLSSQMQIVNKLLENYTQEELDEELKLQMYQSVLDETLNTILGYVVSSPNCKYKNLELSTPLVLDKMIIENLSSNKDKYLKQINTNIGDISLTVFNV